MDENMKKQVQELIDKAVAAEKSEDALRFTQAALNATHAFNNILGKYDPK